MRKTPFVLSAALAVLALGLLVATGRAVIFTLLTDEFDDREQVHAVAEVKEVKALGQEMDALKGRLRRLNERDIEALFGRPTPKPEKTFAMPVAQPRSLALSGFGYADAKLDKHHTEFYTAGQSAGIQVYYGLDGVSPQAVLFYLRADQDSPRLTKENLDKRLAWERERLDNLSRLFEQRRAAVFVWEVDPEQERQLNQGDYAADPAAKLKSWHVTGDALGYRLTTQRHTDGGLTFSWHRPDGTLARQAFSSSAAEPPHRFIWYHDDGKSEFRSESCSGKQVMNWRWCRRGTTDNIRYETSDGDGRPTTWCWYDKDGKAVRSEWDTNGDGVPDRYREDVFYKQDDGLPMALERSWAIHPELIPPDSRISGQPERRVPLRKIPGAGPAEDTPSDGHEADESERDGGGAGESSSGRTFWREYGVVGLVALAGLSLGAIALWWILRRARAA